MDSKKITVQINIIKLIPLKERRADKKLTLLLCSSDKMYVSK
jgi:hypothetical protein